MRIIHLAGATGKPRMATLDGRDHLVVPVIALMEGVIHAVNADDHEFVPAAALARAAHTWNGRPLVLGHPTQDGRQISANAPDILERQAFGVIFQSRMNGSRLGMEAWIDPKRLEALGQTDLLRRVREGDPIEVSVGAHVATFPKEGRHLGKRYGAEWGEIVGDHLAFLPKGVGACSLEMGCGAWRTAMAWDEKNEKFKAQREPGVNKSLKERIGALLRAAGQPYDSPNEAASEEAAELVGYRATRALLDQVQATWDEAYELVEALIADEEKNPAGTTAEEAAETEVENARLEALQALCGNMSSALSAVYSLAMGLMHRNLPAPTEARYAEELRAATAKTFGENMKAIQAAHDASHEMHVNTVGLGASCDPKALTAGSPCGCHGHKETDMKREDRIKALLGDANNPLKSQKALEAATDDELGALETHCAGIKAAQDKTASDLKAAQDKATALETENAGFKAAAAKTPTQAEMLAAMPEVKALVDREAARSEARKGELVGQLKAAQKAYTEEELKALSLDQLERIATIAKIDQPAADFSGRGIPRVTGAEAATFEAPDAYAAGRPKPTVQ